MDASMSPDPAALFERRALRERAARREAERLLEDRSLELFALNEALRHSDARIRAILDNLTEAVVTHATDRRIGTFSASAQAMFGYTVDTARLMPVDTLVVELDCNEEARHLIADWRAMNADAIVGHPMELVCRRQDGTRFDCEVSIGLLEAEQKNFIVSFRDIRRRKENEKKKQEMESMLHQSQRMEAIGTLAAGIAHEINTPLQYVCDNIGFLADAFGDIATATDELAASEIGRAPLMQEALAAMDWSFLQAELPHALNEARDGT
jgi:two-component system NtrC family sensor kinase